VADVTITGAGGLTAQDEDVLEYTNGTWSVWFDGTAHGLTSNGLDVDAFSIPGTTTPATSAIPLLRGARTIVRPLLTKGIR
ncbi:MAG: hypothetical protein IE926_08940, partial [Micrococcales bacterium]|nr:hypothetical protein [Micrococcales bacterium]